MLWYVIPVIGAFLVVVLLLDLMILFYYEHPDDSNSAQALVAKGAAVVGLELVWLLLTVVPTDAFNGNSMAGLSMDVYWEISLLFTLVYMIFPIPMAVAFYQADTDSRITKTPAWRQAVVFSSYVLVGCLAVYAACYFGLRNTQMEVCIDDKCELTPTKTPFAVFSAILIGFFGWILVSLYLAVGLVAVPQELIVGFIYRPKPVNQQDYSDAKAQLGEQISALKAVGESLRDREIQLKSMSTGVSKWNGKRILKNDLNKFKQSVHVLEQDFEALNVSLKERGENPFFSYLKLAGGCFCFILSLAWYMHLIVYVLLSTFLEQPILGGFLNGLFEAISTTHFYGLDLMLYEFFIGYLMLCQMIGCFHFNLRLHCCFSIHPMKKHETYASSILFNTTLMLISVHGMTHLSYIAFKGYCDKSFASTLYGQYAAYTPVLGHLYRAEVFVWILVVWALIVTILLSVKPKEKVAFSLGRIKKMKIAGYFKEGKDAKEPGTEAEKGEPKEGGGLFTDFERTADQKVGHIDKVVKIFL